MEELLKLLKEYAPDYCKDYPDDIIMDEIVISKRFGFIKWLVDNDKIDFDKVDKSWNNEMSFVDFKLDNIMEIRIKVVLMLLATSDTPIDDLISYLK